MKLEAPSDRIFKVLGNKTRLNIVRTLFAGNKTIDDLSEGLGISKSTCRHHIKLLLQYGYLTQSQEIDASSNPQIVYSIGPRLRYVDFPQRRYLALAEGLATYLRPLVGDSTFKEVISKVGESMGIATVVGWQARLPDDHATIPAFLETFVKGYLKSIGAEPVILNANDSSATYRITNCGYREVAFNDPDIYCDNLESGFNFGVSEAMGNVLINRLACAAKGDCHCEFAVELKPKQ